MFLFLHIMTTNRPWIFHELFSTTNLHESSRISTNNNSTQRYKDTEFFYLFLRNACVFLLFHQPWKCFYIFFLLFDFLWATGRTPYDMERWSKTASLRKKEEKHFWMTFGKRWCLRKNAKAFAKRPKKNWVHKTHDRGAVRINEQLHGNYMFLFLHIITI